MSAEPVLTVDEDWNAFLRSISTSASDLELSASHDLSHDASTTHLESGPSDANPQMSSTAVAVSDKQTMRKRQIQSRFRARVKSRQESTKTLLIQTQDRLQHLVREHNCLRTQYELLENLLIQQGSPAAILARHISPTAPEAAYTLHRAKVVPEVVMSLLWPAVRLTSWTRGAYFMTPHHISMLPMAHFARLYRAVIHQMQALLAAAAKDQSDTHTQQMLNTCLVEGICLRFSLFAHDPAQIARLSNASMADGATDIEHALPVLDAMQEALKFTKAQMWDMLALRRLFFGKVGRLSLERQALLQQMVDHRLQLPKLTALAGELQRNVAEQEKCYLQMLTASCLGIPTAIQAAIGMVSIYPALINSPFLEQLAVRYGEPTIPDLMTQVAGCNHLTWSDVENYVESLSVSNMSAYVPFLATVAPWQLCLS